MRLSRKVSVAWRFQWVKYPAKTMYSYAIVGVFLCVLLHFSCCNQISKILNELESLGFKDKLLSDDDFTTSFHCSSCQATITHSDRTKMAWLLCRHSETDRHKMLCGWTLTADYKVVKSVQKSKYTVQHI